MPSGCVQPDGMGSTANDVEEDLASAKTAGTAQTSRGLQSMLAPSVPRGCSPAEGLQEMPKMQKIQKRRGFNGLAGIGQPAGNWQKMQKFTSEATAVHAPARQSREAVARRRTRHPAVKTTVTSY
ncbi:MAG: hypothetical protein GEV13_19290 [Rhodospirillales bacterium]|nr:hypothetical protein [Rhodospirillales bacterium]